MIFLLSGCLTIDFMFYSGPTADSYAIEPDLVPEANIELVPFQTADGLQLWGAWAHQDEPGADVVVYFHGKSADLHGHWQHRVEPLWALGYEVFIFDYRGYGASDGTQDGAGILEEDGLAAVEFVSTSTGRPPEDLYWYGLSLGGAVAAHTTDEIPARALVMESVFASADFMLDGTTLLDLPPAWFTEAPADNVAAIQLATAPVFVIHGLDDDFVSPASGPLLYDAAPEPKELWQPAGVDHDSLVEVDPEGFAARVTAFYDRY